MSSRTVSCPPLTLTAQLPLSHSPLAAHLSETEHQRPFVSAECVCACVVRRLECHLIFD